MPAPNLITDLVNRQLPASSLFSGLYGLNAIAIDPEFGTQIIRLTDASSDLTGHFDSLQTADASQNMLWNSNDTLILVKNTGGYSYLIQWDPIGLQGTQIPSFSTANSTAFASTNPGILYEIVGTVLNEILFTFTAGAWVYTSTTPIADFGNAGAGGPGFLPAGFVAGWNSAFTHDNNDGTFTVAFSAGDQDTGFYVCCYQVGSGYRILNTDTGAITGQWGETGAAVITNWQGLIDGTPNAFPFLLHETFQSRNPAYAHVTPVKGLGGNPLIWAVGTLSLSGVRQGGHCSQGYLADYTGGYGDGQFQAFPYADTIAPTFIMDVSPNSGQLPADQDPKQSYIGDQHAGLPNGGPTDNCLLWVGNGPPPTFPFTSCWEGEIRGIDITGQVSGVMGTVFRACHTYNSCQSPQFIGQNTMAVPSQTGNFIAFTSDWGGSGTLGPLGSITGGATGVIGGTARCDVFIVAAYSRNSGGGGVTPVASTTAIATSGTPANQGANVTFTATVTGSVANPPTGEISFYSSPTNGGSLSLLGTANLSAGAASFSIATLPLGALSITAVYSGDAYNNPSSSAAIVQNIIPAANQAATSTYQDPFDLLLTLTATILIRTPASVGGYGGAPSLTPVGTNWPCRVATFSVPVDKEMLAKGKEDIAYKKVYMRPWFQDQSPDGSYVPDWTYQGTSYNTQPLTHDHWLEIRGDNSFDIFEIRNPGDMDHHLEVICRLVQP